MASKGSGVASGSGRGRREAVIEARVSHVSQGVGDIRRSVWGRALCLQGAVTDENRTHNGRKIRCQKEEGVGRRSVGGEGGCRVGRGRVSGEAGRRGKVSGEGRRSVRGVQAFGRSRSVGFARTGGRPESECRWMRVRQQWAERSGQGESEAG